jgi:glycosyltransferase involved in cell wall biosynthesis
MKVAVYTIALNEADFIQRWYDSAKDADYLFIADTGSKDGTYEIAEDLGIEVVGIKVLPWRFDAARNAALAMLPEDVDYCIALDMDEILLPGWRKELQKAHERGWTRPRYQYTWSWHDNEKTIPGLQYGGDKIHTRSGYRWKHPVHEVLVADRIEETQGWIGLEIHHHPDNTKPRSQYMPLLELSVKEDPWDDRNAYYYARELFFHQRYLDAFKEFKRFLYLPTAVWKPERAAAMRYMSKCVVKEEREKWLQLAVNEDPKRREGLVDLALFYFEHYNWKDCLRYAKQATKIQDKPLDYLCEDFAWGSVPYDLVAICSYHLEYYDQAVLFGKKAVKINPKDKRLADNLTMYKDALLEKKQ